MHVPIHRARREKGPLIHLSCVRGTTSTGDQPSPVFVLQEKQRQHLFSKEWGFGWGFFFLSSSRYSEEEEEVLKVLDAGASGMWAL